MQRRPPHEPAVHTDVRGDFHTQRDAIDDAFIRASFEVAGALPLLTTGFLGGDYTVKPRAIELSSRVGAALEEVEDRGFVLLTHELRGELVELAERAATVFTAGADAWRRRDALAVSEVEDADDGVDDLQKLLLQKAASIEKAGDEMLVVGLIARYYERIADHGVAIARDAAFVATGQRIRAGMQGHRARGSDD